MLLYETLSLFRTNFAVANSRDWSPVIENGLLAATPSHFCGFWPEVWLFTNLHAGDAEHVDAFAHQTRDVVLWSARFISFDIWCGSADLGADKTRSQIKCFVLCSFFSLYWSLGSSEWAWLPQNGCSGTCPVRSTRVRSTARRRSKKIGGLSWPTPSQNLPSVVRKFWTFSSLASYIIFLRACIPDRTDSWCERLRFRTRANVGMFFAFEWWRVEIGRHEIFASLVCTASRVSVENLRKTSIAQQVTALPIFKSQLDISTQLVSMTVFYKGKICLISKETTSLHARLSMILVPFFLSPMYVKFGHRLFTTHLHVSDYILLKTQMGNENRWQIELLRRFGVYTFREWEDPSWPLSSDPLTLWRRCTRRNVGEVLSPVLVTHLCL